MTKNTPNKSEKSSPEPDMIGGGDGRKFYAIASKISDLAVAKYRKNGRGLIADDLVHGRLAPNKSSAQDKLQRYVRVDLLFISPILRQRPQQYFPSCIRAEILERLKTKNLPKELTGGTYIGATLDDCLQSQKADSFWGVLTALGRAPLFIHKIILKTKVPADLYNMLNFTYWTVDPTHKGKTRNERIGKRSVTITVYRNGSLVIAVESSSYPFKIDTDDDVVRLLLFLGHVRQLVTDLLSDIRHEDVPDLLGWILLQCDLNKDIDLTLRGQLTSVDLQLTYAGRVLRMYTKVLGSKAVCRLEESVTINTPILDALKSFRPNKDSEQPNLFELQAQIQALRVQLAKGFQFLCEQQEATNRRQLDQTEPSKIVDGVFVAQQETEDFAIAKSIEPISKNGHKNESNKTNSGLVEENRKQAAYIRQLEELVYKDPSLMPRKASEIFRTNAG